MSKPHSRHSHRRRRRLAIPVALLLTAASLAGCAASASSIPVHTGTALTITPEQAMEDLVNAVEGAAAQVGGTMDGQLTANRCARELGDGVQFVYSMGLPDNQDVPATLSRVAALWDQNGISNTLADNQVLHAGEVENHGDASVWSVALTARDAYSNEPSQYDIMGVSLCAPGYYIDYAKIAAGHRPIE